MAPARAAAEEAAAAAAAAVGGSASRTIPENCPPWGGGLAARALGSLPEVTVLAKAVVFVTLRPCDRWRGGRSEPSPSSPAPRTAGGGVSTCEAPGAATLDSRGKAWVTQPPSAPHCQLPAAFRCPSRGKGPGPGDTVGGFLAVTVQAQPSSYSSASSHFRQA